MKATVAIAIVGAALGACGINVASAQETVDGIYAALPRQASDTGQMTVSLAGLLLPSSRFAHVDIVGRVEKVGISVVDGALRVIVYDSSGAAVVDDTLKVESRHDSGHTVYVFSRRWKLPGSGETGATAGETTVALSKGENEDLRADVTTAIDHKGFFSSKPVISHDWLIYAHR